MDAKKLDTGSRDAISCLPEEVLGDILSLIPTKLAASTSVLSKKWRNVFALVHNLDFDDSVFLQPEEGKDEWEVIRESFRNFVDRTLALQCTSIKNFSLKYFIDEDSEVPAYVCRWICNALERGVKELYLSLKPRFLFWRPPVRHGPVFLPYELYTSKTLVKLTLGTKLNFGELPQDVSLPALKSLFMDSVVFACGELCDVLLPGCPVLEELYVRHEYEAYPDCISSRTIKKLSVHYDYEMDIDCMSGMSFDAPSLVSLDYCDYALAEYRPVNLESLVEARLDLRYSEEIERPDISGLINGISNVEILHLSPDSVDVISRCVKYGLVLPVFNNLASLSFGSINKRVWKLLPYLLKQSPNLGTITIQQGLHVYTCDLTMGVRTM